MTFAGENNGLKEIRDRAGHGRKKRGLDAPPGVGKKRKSGKSKAGRGMGEKKGLGCPAGSGKEEKKREK